MSFYVHTKLVIVFMPCIVESFTRLINTVKEGVSPKDSKKEGISTSSKTVGLQYQMAEGDEPVHCIADTLGGDTIGGASAPYYPEKRWTKKQLKVAFVNPQLSWRFTVYPYDFITTGDILERANEWSSERHGLKGVVPEFVPCREEDRGESDIRVKFMCKSSSRV